MAKGVRSPLLNGDAYKKRDHRCVWVTVARSAERTAGLENLFDRICTNGFKK